MIPTPIRQVLSTFQSNGVQALLMGGQASVFYGAAQISKDIDFVVLADEINYARLLSALSELQAERIAVPRFDPRLLEKGHAVHFRCRAPGVEGLRVDLMTRFRNLPSFAALWERRTSFVDDSGLEYHLLCIPDLVTAKKTQRERDWPVIELLVTIHYREHSDSPTLQAIDFWLREARTPELLVELHRRFPERARALQASRPLLSLATGDDLEPLRVALDEEARAEKALDRAFWEPLRRELEALRHEDHPN